MRGLDERAWVEGHLDLDKVALVSMERLEVSGVRSEVVVTWATLDVCSIDC